MIRSAELPMMLLAIEFSSASRSVALIEQAHPGRPAVVLAALSEEGARSAKPLPLIETVLTRAGVHRDRVDTLAVGLGPGSYTGIRSAIALAQGWQLARAVRLLGVSTVDCLAFQAQAQGWLGSVSLAIDAQRDEFYLATYKITARERLLTEPLKLVTREELRLHAEEPGRVLAGPGAPKGVPNLRVLFPQAAALGYLAAASKDNISGEKLEPVYLREVAFVKAPPPRVLPD